MSDDGSWRLVHVVIGACCACRDSGGDLGPAVSSLKTDDEARAKLNASNDE
jgi:hypothetical protein